MNYYLIGSVVRFKATVNDPATGAPVNATTAVLTIKTTAGTLPPITLAGANNPNIGAYQYEYKGAVAGKVGARLETTNPDDAQECEVFIEPSKVV